jgi:hypothetical protein
MRSVVCSRTLRLPDRCRRLPPDAYAGETVRVRLAADDPASLRVHAPRLQSAHRNTRHTCYSHRSISGAKLSHDQQRAMSSDWNRASASRRGNYPK